VGVDGALVTRLTEERNLFQQLNWDSIEQVKELSDKIKGHVKRISELERENGAQISIQVRLKGELFEVEQRLIEVEVNFHSLEVQNDRLQRELDSAKHAQELAEARVGDLQGSLRIERERFDRSLDFEREADRGLRIRTGMLPAEKKTGNETVSEPKAVSQRRPAWGAKQTELERQAKEAADATEKRWREKIAEVEKKDNEHVGNDGTTAEGTGTSPESSGSDGTTGALDGPGLG
jgi:hypothetical protein